MTWSGRNIWVDPTCKSNKCFKIIRVRLEYLMPYNSVQIICIQISYLKL